MSTNTASSSPVILPRLVRTVAFLDSASRFPHHPVPKCPGQLLFRAYSVRGVPAAASADLLLVVRRLAVWLVADV
jgi:hypothetical protein